MTPGEAESERRERAAALRAVRRPALRVAEATEVLHQSIRRAAEAGVSYRAIAVAAGLSHPTVAKIVREETS